MSEMDWTTRYLLGEAVRATDNLNIMASREMGWTVSSPFHGSFSAPTFPDALRALLAELGRDVRVPSAEEVAAMEREFLDADRELDYLRDRAETKPETFAALIDGGGS